MKDYAIAVESLSKKYVIGHNRSGGPTTFRDVLSDGARALTRRLLKPRYNPSPTSEDFWALKDVSFGIQPGERVGIVGRNGAGKSTLLKILSRITEPSTGRIRIQGRVASLLEVGTGFHPELTGRENIYLNGAVLGMSRTEIKRKFDEIVDFSEVEKFLDTPVKRYSSGMYVRLAFAVAAHLEPEILIVDEVLAVGDSQFQDKCLGKMEEVSSSGRTVLFVSHNMDSIRKLCSRGVYLKAGSVEGCGPIADVIEQYLGQFRTGDGSSVLSFESGGADFYISRIEILDLNGSPMDRLHTWDGVRFRILFHAQREVKAGSVVLQLSTLAGQVISLCSTQPDQSVGLKFVAGWNQVDCIFPKLMLSAGRYLIGAGLAIPNMEWLYRKFDHSVVTVFPRDVYHSGLSPETNRYMIAQEYSWEVQLPTLIH